jgi:hypothetical protein
MFVVDIYQSIYDGAKDTCAYKCRYRWRYLRRGSRGQYHFKRKIRWWFFDDKISGSDFEIAVKCQYIGLLNDVL